MPNDAANQFERAVRRLDQIADDMHQARRRDRIVGLAVVASVALAGWWITDRVQESSASARARCRDANVRFDGMMDVLEDSLGDDPAAAEIITQLREASVIDCDRDGDTADDLDGASP